jgi:hypothetical protein
MSAAIGGGVSTTSFLLYERSSKPGSIIAKEPEQDSAWNAEERPS